MATTNSATSIPFSIGAAGLVRLEAEAADDITLQVALAWHLRQRDTGRALALADAAEALLPVDAQVLRARLRLVRAEAGWLRAKLAAATELSLQAQAEMMRAGDGAGVADALVLQAMLAQERGDQSAVLDLLSKAHAQAEQAGDAARSALAQAMTAFDAGFGDIDEAERHWGGPMAALQSSPDSLLAMWAWDFCAQVDYRRGRFVEAISGRYQAYHHAVASGQTRRVILACLNTGTHYFNLNNNDAALRWIEQGMQLARPTGWPSVNGGGLQLLGRVLAELGRLEAAREAMDEAVRVLLPVAGSTIGRLASFQACHLAARMGDNESAVAGLRQLLSCFEADGSANMVQKCLLELAPALAQLGRHQEALATVERALQMAQAELSSVAEIDALGVAAEVHDIITRGAPWAVANRGARPALALLQRAIELSAQVPNYVTPASTWDQLAAEHALLGDHVQAHAAAQQAGLARQRSQQQETSNRALAMSAQIEIERMQVEHERLHEQAELSAQRASLLQSTHDTLKRLGHIGLEIAEQLDVDAVFARIYGHLQALVDAPHLSIWLVDEATQTLRLRFGIESGSPLPATSVAVQSANSNLARCLRDEHEVEYQSHEGVEQAGHLPRRPRMRTELFGPLRVRERIVGVMSIQSPRPGAYGERERLVFRTLCAYGAVALGNAAVYSDLSCARGQLQVASAAEHQARHQAERATLLKNELLAHVSDALRKPLGSLHETLLKLQPTALAADGVSRQLRLRAALEQCQQVTLLAREMLDLARLESGAVQLAREPFSLAELTQDVLHKLQPVAAGRGQRLSVHAALGLPDVVADIAMIDHALSAFIQFTLQRAMVGSEVQVHLTCAGDALRVEIISTEAETEADSEAAAQPLPWPARTAPDGSHLGLTIARQMLLLHGSPIDESRHFPSRISLGFSLCTVPL